MEKMIGYCGIVCSECPTLLATQKDDDEARKQVVKMKNMGQANYFCLA